MTKESGFTRMEVAIVAVVLLLGLAAAGPFLWNRHERRTQAACIANLKQIYGAAYGWSLENKTSSSDTYAFTDFAHYLRGSVLPICPRGGTYAPGKTFADNPRCSVPGHTL